MRELAMNTDLKALIDEALFYIWDPIGLNLMPCYRDEYRNYVDRVFQNLHQHGSSDALTSLLFTIMTLDMGLEVNKARTLPTANLAKFLLQDDRLR